MPHAAKGRSILNYPLMKTKGYVQLVTVAAVLTTAVVLRWYPGESHSTFTTLGTLGALALTADLLAFLLPGGMTGSISFIPYITAVILAPDVYAVAAVVTCGAIAQLSRDRSLQKFVFNCSQLAITYGGAVVAY